MFGTNFQHQIERKKLFIALYSAQLSLRGHASYPCIVLPVKMVTFRAERDKKQGWHIFLKPFKIGFQKNETRCFVRSTAPLDRAHVLTSAGLPRAFTDDMGCTEGAAHVSTGHMLSLQ